MNIGAHLSIAGGISNAAQKAKKHKLNSLQIFSGSPRGWQAPIIDSKEIKKFKTIIKKAKISPVFIHAKYLTSPGSERQDLQKKSTDSLINDMKIAEKIGAVGVIFHPKLDNLDIIVKNIQLILKNSPVKTQLILENSARMKIEDLGKIFKKIKSKRLTFCLDTAHAFEAGYNLNDTKEMIKLFDIIQKNIGFKRLVAIHTNNSKTAHGSNHDIHADLSSGQIIPEVFSVFVNHPKTKNIPFILETPSLKEKEWQSTEKNISFLIKLTIAKTTSL